MNTMKDPMSPKKRICIFRKKTISHDWNVIVTFAVYDGNRSLRACK
jgi:hypothetical protein